MCSLMPSAKILTKLCHVIHAYNKYAECSFETKVSIFLLNSYFFSMKVKKR